MFGRFEYITNLQYKVKSLESQVDGFQSGVKYWKMRSNFQKQLAERDQKIKSLKHERAAAHCQTVTVRKHWLQVIEDLEKEHANELRKKEREIKEMEERALRAERRVDELRDKLKEKNSEVYQVKTELEEEQGKNQKLLAQLNRDYENSSIPSSMKPNRKKITNNREKTGKKPGGQPGHPGHGRKRHTPTRVIEIPAPEKYTDSSDYKPTGRMITKRTAPAQGLTGRIHMFMYALHQIWRCISHGLIKVTREWREPQSKIIRASWYMTTTGHSTTMAAAIRNVWCMSYGI